MRSLLALTFLAAFAPIAAAQSSVAIPRLVCVSECAINPPPPARVVGLLPPPSTIAPPRGRRIARPDTALNGRVRADWRKWFATVDSVERCSRYPMLLRAHGKLGEFTIHRTPAGGTCQAGPGPGSPTVWVYDSRVFCPDSNPDTWLYEPRRAPRVDEKNVESIEVTSDTAVLRSYRCPIRAAAAIIMRTKRRD